MRPVATPHHTAQQVSTQHAFPTGVYLLSQRSHASQVSVFHVWVLGGAVSSSSLTAIPKAPL